MIISYQWLLEYLPEAVPVEELGGILTSIGLEVEAIEAAEVVRGSLAGLVIGQVLDCEKHPNADKLSITKIDINDGTIRQIVCGAPNVAKGQKVIIAPVGTTVYPTEGEPFLIKAAKIRGSESQGMICAEDEIGLGKEHDGIMILPETAPVGTLARDYFNIPQTDFAIHIGLTPNRSDAMSHTGVARDICAYLSHHIPGKQYKVQLPSTDLPKLGRIKQEIAVNIRAEAACARYAGISISGVKIGTSPKWLQERLQTISVRSINNVVDITNFILHEFGQPLHAFDADKIKGNVVNVQFLPKGSKFLALDGKEIKLNDNDLMICDEKEGMCIAGVFGGLHSGVTDTTTNIFLESAYFDPTHIRRTSIFHGLRTDAATHFEKGVDISNVIPALKRAASLIVEIAGGEISSEIIDVYSKQLEQVEVQVSYDYINKLSGKEYSKDSIKGILVALGFEIINENNNGLTLAVPSNKTDVKQAADIVEEILRIDGLNNVVIPERLNISLTRPMPNDRKEREKVANTLTGMGFTEIVTNSIVNSKYYPGKENLVRMLNSLSSELDVMRPSMLESGLEVIQYNVNRKNSDLLLYEFGKVYTQEAGKYIEDWQLAIFATGDVQTAGWNSRALKTDMFYVKGLIRKLLQQNGIEKTAVIYEGDSTTWKWKNQVLCKAEEVPARKLQEFDIKQQEVYYAVINWELWMKAVSAVRVKYTEVPKFPAVQRDLAIILDKNVSYEQVQQITEQQKIDALKQFGLFDVFESDKLGMGKKSYALNYTFQLQDRTLTDAEIEQVMQQLMNAYKTKLQAQIRE
jgi:phenylalanyl-tRNA synthetase beta chain